MFGKKEIQRLEQKIDELAERLRIISERQNSQYTDIMMILNKDEIIEEIDNYPTEELYQKIRKTIIEAGKVSTSYIQRKFKLGYTKAAHIMDLLEERGVIGPGDGAKPRKVLIKPEEE